MYSEERSDPELAVLLPRVAGDDEDNHGARHQLTGINGTDELQHDRMREEVGKMRTLTLDAYVSTYVVPYRQQDIPLFLHPTPHSALFH